MRIVDLTLEIGEDTLSPPSVNTRLQLTSYHRGPGFWQASEVNMLLRTCSHVDFGRHCAETAAEVSLDRVCGDAIVIDLTFLGEDEPITVAMSRCAGPTGPRRRGATSRRTTCGRPTASPPIPAIANAVADAIGVQITDLPITPEKVLRALESSSKEAAS